MKAKYAVGKRIVAIEQHRINAGGGRGIQIHVGAIVLDDGTRLVPNDADTEDGSPTIDMLVIKNGKRLK